ncbi:hypothetical protein [Psychromonas sp. SP041]|uniref:hypothetical protein n=1 Tax=Psychromonas sp. SP041 TaxID=1365007 RepID=UPI0010C7ABC4|nr:hypothetical protein [Psychromonas sp. SP041]
MATSDNNNNKVERDTHQEYLDEMFEPGELEAIMAHHTNADGEHEPQLPKDWTEEDNIAATKSVEDRISSYCRFKMDVDRDALISILINAARVPPGFPVAKESMQLPPDKRFNSYDELRDWFVEKGFNIAEADLSAELHPEFVGSLDDVFEEIQTIEAKESYGADDEHDKYVKKYLHELRKLGVTKIDRDYHRVRRTLIAEDPHVRMLALRIQRHHPSDIMEETDIYAHEVEVEGMECPEELVRSDYNRHLYNPDNLEYVGHEDNRHESDTPESKDDESKKTDDAKLPEEEIDEGLKPSPISRLLLDLDDYAPGGPKQYRRPKEDTEEHTNDNNESTLDDEPSDDNNENTLDDEASLDDENIDNIKNTNTHSEHIKGEGTSSKRSQYRQQRPKHQQKPKQNTGNYNKRPNPQKNNNGFQAQRIPNVARKKTGHKQPNHSKQNHGYGGFSGGANDLFGLGAVAGLIGKGVKSATKSVDNVIYHDEKSNDADGIADISLNEFSRATATAKEALNKVHSKTNSSGQGASEEEQEQNIEDLNNSFNDIGKKLKDAYETCNNPDVSEDIQMKANDIINEASELTDSVDNLPDEVKNKLSEQALNVMKVIKELLKNLFKSNDSEKESSGPSF